MSKIWFYEPIFKYAVVILATIKPFAVSVCFVPLSDVRVGKQGGRAVSFSVRRAVPFSNIVSIHPVFYITRGERLIYTTSPNGVMDLFDQWIRVPFIFRFFLTLRHLESLYV
jgi:hypothetical protein